MTTLRVYIASPPKLPTEMEWALFDHAGAVIRRGRTPIAGWPAAQRREAVIAAAHGRLAVVKLPPLAPARLQSAASYALEEQLAGAPEDSHAAAGHQAADGSVRVAIVGAAWMRAFQAASKQCSVVWTRVLLESDLAHAPAGGWCWCADSLEHAGFVRTANGSSISVGPAGTSDLPEEMQLALEGTVGKPGVVRVDLPAIDPARLERARAQTGIDFTPGQPWEWSGAGEAAFRAAIDLQAGSFAQDAAEPRTNVAPLFRPALWIAGATLVALFIAGSGEWLSLQWQLGSLDRELADLAQVVSVDANNAGGSKAATGLAPAAAISRRDGELRHRAGLAAADDMLPLLARAASAMPDASQGAIRSLHYADSHVVFELQKLDAERTTRLQRELASQGLVAIAVPTASGVRLRIGLD